MKIKILIILLAFACSTTVNAQKKWTLQECIRHAKDNSITIRMQDISQQNQELKLSTAKNQRLPNLSATANQTFSFGRGASPADNSYQSLNSSSTSLSLSSTVPLFTGFQIPNEIAAAKFDLQAAIADFEKAREDIELAVISAYLQILYNKELLEITINQQALSAQQLDRIEELYRSGKSSEAQVYEVKSQIANDELAIVQARNDLQLSLLNLTQLLELPSPENFDVETPDMAADFILPANPDETYANALATRATVRADEYRLASSQKTVKIARSAYYPQLSFGAGYSNNYYKINGYNNSSFAQQLRNNESKYLGFYLNIPVFNRFATRNNIRAAKLNVRNQELQLENTKKNLYKEIQQAYYNATGAKEKYKSSEVALQSAEKAYEFAKEKFENGRSTTYEFNDARNNLMKASANLSQAKYDYIFRKKILDFYNGMREIE
ncbi:MAG: TolC family protein [Prevotellaceae bacterium]|jgi:outer membrane protein|nr:TolC family protein [Prevotellaceae bacterium]